MRSAARLHLGFLDIAGSSGRRFGSVGLSISDPKICVRARLSDELAAFGEDEERRESALRYAKRFYEHPGTAAALRGETRKAAIYLDRTIPAHVGLGSGTQLALCVVMALCGLHGAERSVGEAALIAGRGVRSGIGIEAFKRGGFIIDGGGDDLGNETPLPLFRHNFPRNWRIVLVRPGAANGLSGEPEERAFGGMPADAGASMEICQLVLMKLLPGLLEEKLAAFGAAVERIQRIMGECFSGAQGGRYASPLAEDIFTELRRSGARGMGQSSWGPTLYAFVDGQQAALGVLERVKKTFGESVEAAVTSGRSVGARIERRDIRSDGAV